MEVVEVVVVVEVVEVGRTETHTDEWGSTGVQRLALLGFHPAPGLQRGQQLSHQADRTPHTATSSTYLRSAGVRASAQDYSHVLQACL